MQIVCYSSEVHLGVRQIILMNCERVLGSPLTFFKCFSGLKFCKKRSALLFVIDLVEIFALFPWEKNFSSTTKKTTYFDFECLMILITSALINSLR